MQLVEGFSARSQQKEMAEAIARTLNQRGTLICEAGSGTGKTFAYLVPALMSGKKIIVSTGTKHLQDQLFHRDLPVVRKALALSLRAALLKGRSNYLCLHRLGQAEARAGFLPDDVNIDLRRIKEWVGRSQTGDLTELASISEGAPVWPYVTSTADNCLGQECPLFNDCYVVRARREANEANILVVNHHLFLADMALREEGFGEVLPGADAVIFDEAHQLPEVASGFFGISLSSRQLTDLLQDTTAAFWQEAGDVP
ncbi:MAG: ATP-dependent DNA helicase, partial [Gammaproteobacteria bacterium]|nr:ATP-dependent DNA helicase [Gammaproteobacteria bacterium]